MAVAPQRALQSVAQNTGWTYSVLWHLCPRQGSLVWAEGHYNGAIKTRKTTVHQPGAGDGAGEGEAGCDDAARRRSRQLRELYDSLAAEAGRADGGAHAVVAPPRRPSAALAPEDLSETEWFYLMCASYCFPPAIGLPGQAFARRSHVWLCGANKVDSKVFSRAILARSAGIQTVACIPVDDGILEIGTTEEVEEDIGLIQYARSIFMDRHGIPIMPTISGHSTSTPTTHINIHQPFQITKVGNHILQPNNADPEGEHTEMEDDDDEDDDDRIGSETNTENDSCRHQPLLLHDNVGGKQATPNAGSSEPMQIEMSSERVRDDCSNRVDGEIPMLMVCQDGSNVRAQDEAGQWHFLYEDLTRSEFPQSSAQDQAVPPENAHYVETVLTILRHNACLQAQTAASSTRTYLALSKNSSFSRWSHEGRSTDLQTMFIPHGTTGTAQAQRMLKIVLLIGAPSSHIRCRGEAAQSPEEEARDGGGGGGGEGTSRSRRGPAQQAELSASHVLKERRRREKLNEKFIMLRSLVPFVTKMDRASILGDTIEYVKQLRGRIQELESSSSRPRLVDAGNPTTVAQPPAAAWTQKGDHHSHSHTHSTKRARAAEASGSCSSTGGTEEVQVSIIESDALLELRCPHREGLLLRVMQALQQELRMEVTAVQASSAGDVLLAELRAKVKEVNGRRSSITEVKRTIHLIVSSD